MTVESFGDFDRDEVLRLAASAEARSEHPLGRAIVEAAEAEGLALPEAADFDAVIGHGVQALIEGRTVLVGTARLLTEHGIDVERAAEALASREAEAQTTVLVAIDGGLGGALAIADRVKADAKETVAALARRGVTPALVTGDNQRTAEAIARAVGITEVHAEVLPQHKARLVRELQAIGARVAMVGDGINDAPALMQADVGLAIGAGTDIAIESADVVLIGRRLSAVPEAIAIGAMSYRKTVENITFAFLFNGVGVPVAATGILHPAWAMGAMAASASTVLANSFGGRIFTRTRVPVAHGPERPNPGAPAERDASAADATITLSVPSIRCQVCVETLEAGLRLEAGIARVEGDANTKQVRVAYRAAEVSADAIERAIARLGHRVDQSGGRRVARAR